MQNGLIWRAAAWVDHLGKGLGYVSVLCLLFMMALTVVGVVMRYVFHSPILGVNELIELSSVALVVLAIPYCASEREHISVDILDSRLGATGRFIGDIIAYVTGIVVLSFLTNRSWHKALEALEYDDVTNMIQVPIWPFYGIVTLGAALYLLVLVIQFLQMLARGRSYE
ncbi:MAG: TRAP transporter small permease [Cognatishimia sp.]